MIQLWYDLWVGTIDMLFYLPFLVFPDTVGGLSSFSHTGAIDTTVSSIAPFISFWFDAELFPPHFFYAFGLYMATFFANFGITLWKHLLEMFPFA